MHVLIMSPDPVLARQIAGLMREAAGSWRIDATWSFQEAKHRSADLVIVDFEGDPSSAIAALSYFKADEKLAPFVIAVVRSMSHSQSARMLDVGFDWILQAPVVAADITPVVGATQALRSGRRL
ncbi:MAG: hypothetical protein KJS97_16065 [Alphaproteobacteria bacterium]|nr:hypothetical protein [Alphaproteobacteria bacterium]